MTQTLPGADVRGYYHALGIEIPGWPQANASVRCFADPDAHSRSDHDPSCSINTVNGAWNCHGCGAAGGAYDAALVRGYSPREAIDLMIEHGLTERRTMAGLGHGASRRPPHPRGDRTRVRRHARPTVGVSERDVRHWQTALTEHTDLIGKLTRERGWLYSTMHELGLGYDCGRITIPVRDHDRRLLGLLRYRPWPKPGEPKMHAVYGSRRALLPHPAAEPSRRILLVEGEPDMIAARSHGLPAIAIPGVNAWRPGWARLLAGREVTIVMDCDEEGRRAAERIANDLRLRANALVLDLAPERDDGYDLTDWLLEHPNASNETLP